MKSITMPVREQFDEENRNELFSEVNETVAKTTNVTNQKRRNFTVQEMWSRQRQMRSASDMMRRGNLN